MSDPKLLEAVRALRKELIVKDEPLKAYNLLVSLNLPELKPEMERTFSMVRHMFDYDFYKKYHEESLPEFPEPEEVCLYINTKWPRYEWMLKEIEKLPNIKTVLDLGCADGAFCLTLANKGYTTHGINLNKESVRIAKERATKFNLDKRCAFQQGDVFDVGIMTYDVVIISEIIEHVPDPKKLVDLAARMAIHWVFLTTPNGPFMNGQGNLPQWDCKGPDDIRGHVRVYTKKTIEELLKDYEIGQLIEAEDGLLQVMYRKKKNESI